MDLERKKQIISGNFSGEKISEFGITHYSYADCSAEKLTETIDKIPVRKECLDAFEIMRKNALKVGLEIKIISGFRSSKYQIEVFSRKFANKDQVSDKEFEARLKYSAPSGFSEHHTGLAVDINSLEEDFEKTSEFAWLNEHAKEYGFEMSFPRNNVQGLGYEPWHWRYIGKSEEFETVFAKARNSDTRFQ